MWLTSYGLVMEWSLDESRVFYGTYKTDSNGRRWLIDGNTPIARSDHCFIVSSPDLLSDDKAYYNNPIGAKQGGKLVDGAQIYRIFKTESGGYRSDPFVPETYWPSETPYNADWSGVKMPYQIRKVIQTGNNLAGKHLDGDLKMCAMIRQGSSSTQSTDNYFYPIYVHNFSALLKQMNLILKERKTKYIKFDLQVGGKPFAQMGFGDGAFIGRTTMFRQIRAAITNVILLKNIVGVDDLSGLQALPTSGFADWVVKAQSTNSKFLNDFYNDKISIERQASLGIAAAIGAGQGLFGGLSAQWQWQQQADWSRQMQRERLDMMEKLANINNQARLNQLTQSGAQQRITQQAAYQQQMNALGAGSVSAQNGMYTPSNYTPLPSYKSNTTNYYNNSVYHTDNNITNNPSNTSLTNNINNFNPELFQQQRERMPTPSEAYDNSKGFVPQPGTSKSIATENINPNYKDEEHIYEPIEQQNHEYADIDYNAMNISRENKNSSNFGNVGILDHQYADIDYDAMKIARDQQNSSKFGNVGVLNHQYAELDFSKNNTRKNSQILDNSLYSKTQPSSKMIDNSLYGINPNKMVENQNYEPASMERKNSIYSSNLNSSNNLKFNNIPNFKGPTNLNISGAKPAGFGSGIIQPAINKYTDFSKPN
ncbi:putative structural polyprotein [Solenopsis invicta virus 3]|nr:putative structural polyprotein [Solenopsis invicta virus 3]